MITIIFLMHVILVTNAILLILILYPCSYN